MITEILQQLIIRHAELAAQLPSAFAAALAELKADNEAREGRAVNRHKETATQMATIKGELTSLKGQVGSVKDELTSLKGQVGLVKDELASVNTTVKRIDSIKLIGSDNPGSKNPSRIML
ncbi:hypothetical protein PGT21_034625 [Puccinia graminis f. sp. tritici]|uniref:Uncharacterized protein n=2 Tax=Puccinia graminis f. sp. tritici TaxID=56615 RepID=A0A5B0P0H6_PUCGR|nr:hypothetical protein PGT21_034625 [Puccinia graminis f. sp. tritici]